MKEIVKGDLYEDNGHGSAAGRVYGVGGVSPTIGASHFSQIKYILEEDNDFPVETKRQQYEK